MTTLPESPVYLDSNATTPHAPKVIEAMRPSLEEHFGNPSSAYSYGIATKEAVLKAMHYPEERALGAIRFPTGRPTAFEEIDRAVAVVSTAVKKQREQKTSF